MNAIQKAIRDGKYRRLAENYYGVTTKYGEEIVTERYFRQLKTEVANENWTLLRGYNDNIEHTAFMADIMDAYNDSKLQFVL